MKYLLALLSGVLLGIPFVIYDLALLSWIALIPFFFAIEGVTRKKAFFLGWVMGICFFVLNGYWLLYPLTEFSGFPMVVNLFLFLLVVIILALFIAAFSVILKSITNHNNYFLILVAPVIWTAIEFIRTLLPIQYYFAFLGYSQSFISQLVQLAHYGGVYIITFLIVLFNVLLYLAIKKNKLRYALLGILLFGILFSYGQWQINRPLEKEREINISVIQPNIAQEIKMSSEHQSEVREKIIELSEEEIAKNEPELVVWPETAILRSYNKDSKFPYLLNDDTPLLVGGFLRDETGGNLNSSLLINSENDIIEYYSKMNLVPFGEYTPFSDYMPDVLSTVMGNLLPGEQKQSFDLNGITLSTPICSEILDPFFIRDLQNDNDVITTIANEAWFQDSNLPVQMIQASIFRAVENRSPVVKSGNTGISAFINENGEVIKETEAFTEGALNYTLAINDDQRGLYKIIGDSFGFLNLVLFGGIILLSILKNKEE